MTAETAEETEAIIRANFLVARRPCRRLSFRCLLSSGNHGKVIVGKPAFDF